MRIKYVIFTSIAVLILGFRIESGNKGELGFVKPEIINSQFDGSVKSIKYKEDFVSEVFPTFVGKYGFKSKIDINPELRDSARYRDYLSGYSYTRLDGSADVNGFELFVDYETTVKYNLFYRFDSVLYDHYPVYFVNSTKTDKMFLGKDSYVFGIQEALDNEKWKSWRAIEGRGFDLCGNGRWGVVVHPNEFVLVLMRKYEGDFKTKMRVRFQLGESIYVSKPFEGIIDEGQFYIQDSSYLGKQLREANGESASWLFYGASPKMPSRPH